MPNILCKGTACLCALLLAAAPKLTNLHGKMEIWEKFSGKPFPTVYLNNKQKHPGKLICWTLKSWGFGRCFSFSNEDLEDVFSFEMGDFRIPCYFSEEYGSQRTPKEAGKCIHRVICIWHLYQICCHWPSVLSTENIKTSYPPPIKCLSAGMLQWNWLDRWFLGRDTWTPLKTNTLESTECIGVPT